MNVKLNNSKLWLELNCIFELTDDKTITDESSFFHQLRDTDTWTCDAYFPCKIEFVTEIQSN